ncbi:unnamed protein product [Closterium sp. NIES-53]
MIQVVNTPVPDTKMEELISGILEPAEVACLRSNLSAAKAWCDNLPSVKFEFLKRKNWGEHLLDDLKKLKPVWVRWRAKAVAAEAARAAEAASGAAAAAAAESGASRLGTHAEAESTAATEDGGGEERRAADECLDRGAAQGRGRCGIASDNRSEVDSGELRACDGPHV